VSFHWSETERSVGGATPAELTLKVGPHRAAMRGTESRSPRCVALDGTIGAAVSCSIYARRPSPCREFEASWVNGVRNELCERARAAHGLPPLEAPHRRRGRRPKRSKGV
jgi:Fe-S-cluster containining protein